MTRAAFFCALLLSVAAFPREPDGTLGLILRPNDGAPVVAAPGEVIELLLREPAEIALVGPGGRIALEPTWKADAHGVHGRAMVPTKVAPGRYALEARAHGRRDVNTGAAYVYATWPESYRFLHLAQRWEAQAVADTLSELANADIAFAVLTGDLTGGGAPAEYQALVSAIESSPVPVFVCAGPGDTEHFAAYFGPALTSTFRFGNDGYLILGAGWSDRDDRSSGAEVYRRRRSIRDARWSVGLVAAWGEGPTMRDRITLLVDDPLDYILFGEETQIGGSHVDGASWGRTRLLRTDFGYRGATRVLQAGPGGIRAPDSQE